MVGDMVEKEYWDWAERAMAKYPQAALFFSGSRTIEPDRAHPDDPTASSAGVLDSNLYSYEDFMRDAVQCYNRIGALSGALFRADIMRRALPFEAEFPWTADWRFCKRFLQQAAAVQTTAPLVHLDRSIPRVSTSWKGLRGSFGEGMEIRRGTGSVGQRIPSQSLFHSLQGDRHEDGFRDRGSEFFPNQSEDSSQQRQVCTAPWRKVHESSICFLRWHLDTPLLAAQMLRLKQQAWLYTATKNFTQLPLANYKRAWVFSALCQPFFRTGGKVAESGFPICCFQYGGNG